MYNVLGVDRNSSGEEIKKAYRALALKWHPDRNPGDDEAEQRFKEVTQAYKTLGDPERRSRYDRLGPLYTDDGRPPRTEDLNEVVGTVFNNLGSLFGRRRGAEPGEELRYTVSLSLEEVADGSTKEIVVPRLIRCKTCGGDGADPDGGKVSCTVCKGTGKATGPRLFRTDCYHCSGNGFTVAKACQACSGDGRVAFEDTIKVKVPGGIATGQKLKVAGKGNVARGSGPEGDLLVIVNVADHPLFRRRGEDLLVDLPLTIAELALGGDVAVPTLEGTTTVRIAPATPPGKALRLTGRGLPRVGKPGRGDLHLQIVLEVPQDLGDAQRKALEDWAKSLPPQVHPRRQAFVKALEERRR